MKAFTQNKYAQATLRAFVIGAVTAGIVYFTLLPDPMDTRKLISLVGLSFLGPFAVLIKVLPDPLQVVQLVPGASGERAMLVELPVVKGIIKPVSNGPLVVDPQPVPLVATAPRTVRTPQGQFANTTVHTTE